MYNLSFSEWLRYFTLDDMFEYRLSKSCHVLSYTPCSDRQTAEHRIMVNHIKALDGIKEDEECADVVVALFSECLHDDDSCIALGSTFHEAKFFDLC